MFLTEKQAKEKACCGPITNYRDRERRDYPGCLGSECMAWRWGKEQIGGPDMWTGYCGLAGEPE